MSGSGILLLFLIASVVFLVLGLALVLYVMQYQKRMMQQNDELQLQEAAHQKVLLEASINSQEQERQRIASHLHDSLGAHLSTVRLSLLMHSEEAPDAKVFLEDAAELLSEGIQIVREISHDLLPGALRSYGLSAAWKELTTQLTERTPLTANFIEVGMPQRLEEQHELALYRITQELINNTLKHAQATTIHLHTAWTSEALAITYRDNGIGFDVNQQRTGLGMYTLESRAQMLNASLSISSSSEGTHVKLTVPLTTIQPKQHENRTSR